MSDAHLSDSVTTASDANTTLATDSAETDQAGSDQASVAGTVKPKVLSVPELQSRVLQAFQADFVSGGAAIGIHNSSTCSCGYSLLDEEVLSMWCAYQAQDIHTGASSKSTRKPPKTDSAAAQHSRDMMAAHKLVCPQCLEEFLPTLHVRNYRLKQDEAAACATTDDSSEHVPRVAELVESTWSQDVRYVSPFGLRFELEELVQRVGERVADAHWLCEQRSELYWSVVWYTNRAGLPSGFLSAPVSGGPTDNMFRLPVVVGWRECVVRTRAYRLLSHADPAHAEINGSIVPCPGDPVLGLADIFPSCNVVELGIMRDVVVEKLDGSPASMRSAMTELCRCRSLFTTPPQPDQQTTSDSSASLTLLSSVERQSQRTARVLYVTLLTLAFLYGKTKLVDAPTASVPSDVAKALTKVRPDC